MRLDELEKSIFSEKSEPNKHYSTPIQHAITHKNVRGPFSVGTKGNLDITVHTPTKTH
jgi:hypothetical protein